MHMGTKTTKKHSDKYMDGLLAEIDSLRSERFHLSDTRAALQNELISVKKERTEFGASIVQALGPEMNFAVPNGTTLQERIAKLVMERDRKVAPVPMLLQCPQCGKRHVDAGLFALKPHHTHACQHCGHVWRPAKVHTVGVRFLPGFKDEEV